VGGLVALSVAALLCASLLVLRQGLAYARIDARIRALPGLSVNQIADLLDDYRMDEPLEKESYAAFVWRTLQ
jgi:hypothetical protein